MAEEKDEAAGDAAAEPAPEPAAEPEVPEAPKEEPAPDEPQAEEAPADAAAPGEDESDAATDDGEPWDKPETPADAEEEAKSTAAEAVDEAAKQLKTAGLVALRMYPRPAAEITEFGNARSLRVYLTIILLSIVLLPVGLVQLPEDQAFFQLVLNTAIGNVAFLILVLLGLNLVFRKRTGLMKALAIVAVTWIPLLPVVLIAPLLGTLVSFEAGIIVAGLGGFLSVLYNHLAYRHIGDLSDDGALFFTAITFTVFVGVLMYGGAMGLTPPTP